MMKPKKNWQIEARRKLSDYWAGDWKILDDFISSLLSEQKKKLREKIENLLDKKRAKQLGDDYEEIFGKRWCPFCGTNFEKQAEMILKLLK